jgi:hypothetical protein
MGDFSTILLNDIVINNIWTQICKSISWEDRMLSFFMLCYTNKAWKNLVDGSEEWAHCWFCLLELWSQECWSYINYWKNKSVNLKVVAIEMTIMEKFHSKHHEFELKISAQAMCITLSFGLSLNKCFFLII